MLAVLIARRSTAAESVRQLVHRGPLDHVPALEEQPPGSPGRGVRLAEDFAEHALVVLVRPEPAVAAGAIRPVGGRADEHAPPALEGAFQHEVETVVTRRVALDVLQFVGVRAETRRQPAEDPEHLVVVGVQQVEAAVLDMRHRKIADRLDAVDRLNEPRCPAVGAAQPQHEVFAQPGLERRPDFRRPRLAQIGGDGVQLTVGAAGPDRRHERPDLARLQRPIVIQIIPEVNGPRQGMRIAEAQIVERQARGILGHSEQERQAVVRKDAPRAADVRRESPPRDPS